MIGKAGRYIPESQAMDHVAGYCIVNDVSERDWQSNRAGTWTKGKSSDTFGPIGPYLVTPDEFEEMRRQALGEIEGRGPAHIVSPEILHRRRERRIGLRRAPDAEGVAQSPGMRVWHAPGGGLPLLQRPQRRVAPGGEDAGAGR